MGVFKSVSVLGLVIFGAKGSCQKIAKKVIDPRIYWGGGDDILTDSFEDACIRAAVAEVRRKSRSDVTCHMFSENSQYIPTNSYAKNEKRTTRLSSDLSDGPDLRQWHM